jgi:hypothetical protein
MALALAGRTNKMPLVHSAGNQVVPPRIRFAWSRFELLAAVILLAMAVNLLSVIARKSITTDEVVLIPSAYYHYVADEVHLIAQHPPVCKLLAGLPLLFIRPNQWSPARTDPAGRNDQHEWAYTSHFWQDNAPLFKKICFWSRVPMVALTLALGVLVFVFARDLFGPRAALLAVALFALEPTILAHGRVVQTDIPAAFGLLLTVFALYRYIGAPSWKGALALGGAIAVALLSKFSMLVICPALAVVLAVLWFRTTRRGLLLQHALVVALVILVVTNSAYFFYHRPLTEGDFKWIAECFPGSASLFSNSVRILRFVLPTDFLMGVLWQLHHGRAGHSAGLLGMYSNHGWCYYFPVAFCLKAPIPFLMTSLAGLAWATDRLIRFRERWALFLLIPVISYTILLMLSPIDIGVRYYLPGYVFFVLLSAGCLNALRHFRAAATAIVMGWMAIEMVRSYPNHMSYMNQFAFAHPHWWYLSDSNVEWGDDARKLAAWLRARGESRVRALLLGGFATLDFYGVNYIDALSKAEPPPRYLALGASFLNGSTVPSYERDGKRVSEEVRVNTFDRFRHRTPEAIIGESIYVFRNED